MLSKLPKIVKNQKKRLGRGGGSGKGNKSGRGTTRHQKARTKIPLHFEGGQAKITKKYPLLRGKERNKSLYGKNIVIQLDQLNIFKNNEKVNHQTLVDYGLISQSDVNKKIKILFKGKLEKKLILEIGASKNVIKALEKVGGSFNKK